MRYHQKVSLSYLTIRIISPLAPVTGPHRFRSLAAARARGFTIIEAIVVLTVLISLMSLGARYIQSNLDNSINQAIARHLKQIDKAANIYIKEHYAALTGKPSDLEVDSLIKAGYLPADFFKKNNYQQSYKIRIFPKQQGEKKLLQVVIITQNGQEISEDAMRKISNLVGGQAGYVSVLSPDKITGTQGGWEMKSSDLAITIGHLASVTWVNQQDIIDADGFLRRKKFEGHPEYNTMETDLHLQDHSIQYENGKFTGKLSSNQLLFNHEEQSIEVSLVQGPQIQLKNRNRTVSLNSNQLSFGEVEFESASKAASWMIPSKVDVNWNQVPFYEREQDDTASIWKFADERCEKRQEKDFPQGRMFLVGRKKNREDAGLFICSTPSAENDGYGKEDLYHPTNSEKLNARAYLISKVGRKYDARDLKVMPAGFRGINYPKEVRALEFWKEWILLPYDIIIGFSDELDEDKFFLEADKLSVKKFKKLMDVYRESHDSWSERTVNKFIDDYKSGKILGQCLNINRIFRKLGYIYPNREAGDMASSWEEGSFPMWNDIYKQIGINGEFKIIKGLEEIIAPDNPW